MIQDAKCRNELKAESVCLKLIIQIEESKIIKQHEQLGVEHKIRFGMKSRYFQFFTQKGKC